jgi:hypothetical protein
MLFLIELDTSIRLKIFFSKNIVATTALCDFAPLRETHFAQVITEYATYPGD